MPAKEIQTQQTMAPDDTIAKLDEIVGAKLNKVRNDVGDIPVASLPRQQSQIDRRQQDRAFHTERLSEPKHQLNYVYDTVVLPSMGHYYSPSSSIYGVKEITIRHLCTEDEDTLTTPSYIRAGKVLDILLKNCIMTEGINLDDLLIGDKDAVLIALRITGLGPQYPIIINCPSCSHQFNNTFELGLLQPREVSLSPVPGRVDLFTYKLPVSGKTLQHRLATAGDDKEIEDYMKAIKKLHPNDANAANAITIRLWHYTETIEGETDREKLKDIIRTMPLLDGRSFRKYMNDNQPGLNLQQTVTCPECGEDSTMDIPMGTEFFWPKL